MEALEEVVGVPNKDLFHTVKGKRTKRLRLQPAIPFTVTAPDSLNAFDKNDSNKGEDVSCSNNNNNNNDNNNNSSPSSPPSAEMFINTFTEDEEETARCLILMSKCDDHHRPHKFIDALPPDKFDLFNDDLKLYQTKFNSKRYIETSTNLGNGTKAGIYVYECKTCSRTFPSFQALGGHRASHKKPKTILTTELANNKKSYFDFSDEDDQPSPSTTLYNKNNKSVNNILSNSSSDKYSSPRIHECSYCGAEFTSGQALGGHMRRHRGGANINSPLHLSNVSPATSIDHEEFANNIMKKEPRDELSLDLNLPVAQDNHLDPKFPVVPLKQQDQEQTQRHHLVDCHY